VPMIVAYRLDGFYRLMKHVNRVIPLAKVTSMVLPNIILGENVVPELLDDAVTPGRLADEAVALLRPGEARERQLAAFARIDALMALPDGRQPAEAAAEVVLGAIGCRNR
jgi:lipid-A-disaccharide synthase